MKKGLIIGTIIAVSLIALGVAGLAFAQAQNPPTPQPYPGSQGMMRGKRGMQYMPNAQNMPGLSSMPAIARQAAMQVWQKGFRQGMMRGYAQGMMGPMHEYMIAALAARLDLTVADLQAKINAGERPFDLAKAQGMTDAQVQELMEQAHDEALKAAVAAGVLTQEQAAAMDERMEQMGQNGAMGQGFGMMGGLRGQRGTQEGPLHEYKVEAFAEAVGLTAAQVETRLDAGETMLQIAQSQGLTVEQFRAKMVEASKNAINQALSDGKITQEQATWMLSRVEQMGAQGFGVARGAGRGEGRGAGRFGAGGCPGMGGNLPTQP